MIQRSLAYLTHEGVLTITDPRGEVLTLSNPHKYEFYFNITKCTADFQHVCMPLSENRHK